MMESLASRLHRLDRVLSDLDPDSEAMLLSELDGFIAGLVVCADIIMPGEWLVIGWGDEGFSFESEQQETPWSLGKLNDSPSIVDRCRALLAKRQERHVQRCLVRLELYI